ncbi:MAG TPA: hypothetical protein VL172_06005, partial [Kofleriaceae bacterium]|nr:hypothetical protein [Kofleriaceae bacterium]
DAAEARARAAALGLDTPAAAGAEALVADFRRRFPGGLVDDLHGGGTALAGVDAETRRQMWSDALLAARGGRRRRGSAWEVTAYVPAGEIAVLFAAPRSAPADERRQWREQIERATWAASLAITDGRETPPP